MYKRQVEHEDFRQDRRGNLFTWEYRLNSDMEAVSDRYMRWDEDNWDEKLWL